MKPAAVVTYFPVRGWAEVVRLGLGAAGVEFEEEPASHSMLKSDLAAFPFAQVPRYRDGDIDLTQTRAILRYLGRKHGLYPADNAIASHIDQVVDGIHELKVQLMPLLYWSDQRQNQELKDEHWQRHAAPDSARALFGQRLGVNGAHLLYVNEFVERHGKGFAVGDKLSIADIFLLDMVDLYQSKYGQQFNDAYPRLAALAAKIAGQPNIAAYRASPARISDEGEAVFLGRVSPRKDAMLAALEAERAALFGEAHKAEKGCAEAASSEAQNGLPS